MQNVINLRKADIGDKDSIIEIINVLHLDVPGFVWGDRNFVEKQIRSGEYFLAQLGNEVAGVISFKQRGNIMYIETLAIKEKFRSQGIGTRLVEFAKNFTKDNRLSILRVCSFCEYKAQDFYLKLGFSMLEEPGDYENLSYQRFETRLG